MDDKLGDMKTGASPSSCPTYKRFEEIVRDKTQVNAEQGLGLKTYGLGGRCFEVHG